MGALHFRDEPCEPTCGPDCPARVATERRARGKNGQWGALEARKEPGGWRHYLDGKPVHCGYALELQALEYKADDYGEYTVAVSRGSVVRYEARFTGRGISATLHADVAGHEFVAASEPWMRFRWPE